MEDKAVLLSLFFLVGNMSARLKVVYDGMHYMIVYKSAGVLSQPGLASDSRPVLMSELRGLLSETLDLYSVQRLDACVTGGTVVAKNKRAAMMFSRYLKQGGGSGYGLTRRYLARINAQPVCDEGTIESPGMVTYYRRVRDDCVVVELKTGKKHQIRKHLALNLNCPIVNDTYYGGSVVKGVNGQIALHSAFVRTRIGKNMQDHLVGIEPPEQTLWKSILTENGKLPNDIVRTLTRDKLF